MIDNIILRVTRRLLFKNAGIIDMYIKMDIPNDVYEGLDLPMTTHKRTVMTSAKFWRIATSLPLNLLGSEMVSKSS